MLASTSLRLDSFRYGASSITFLAGETLFEQGDPADAMYVVQSGEVDIIYANGSIERVGPGGIVGEIGFLVDRPHSTTAYAHTDCQVTPVSERTLLFLIHETPTFAPLIMRVMAERLHRLTAAPDQP
jgi:CRP/FNR family cyclic AMP-dependent transcriptional regulator